MMSGQEEIDIGKKFVGRAQYRHKKSLKEDRTSLTSKSNGLKQGNGDDRRNSD